MFSSFSSIQIYVLLPYYSVLCFLLQFYVLLLPSFYSVLCSSPSLLFRSVFFFFPSIQFYVILLPFFSVLCYSLSIQFSSIVFFSSSLVFFFSSMGGGREGVVELSFHLKKTWAEPGNPSYTYNDYAKADVQNTQILIF